MYQYRWSDHGLDWTEDESVSVALNGTGEDTTEPPELKPVDPGPPALTASFSNVPDSHDGSSEFTFNLSFSYNVKAGYARIRDHAFSVSDGDRIKQAKRVTQGSNQNWLIRVKPGGNSDVVLTLPATTDCTDISAICTHGGFKLSGPTSITVLGPTQ